MILHIPHSSTKLIKGLKIPNINENLNILTDWYVDELFYHSAFDFLTFEYSRFVCDVERYLNKEPMEKYGMGALYTKELFGNSIISNSKINKYRLDLYNKHHIKLTNLVYTYLSYFPKVYIIDCHSFSEKTVMDGKENLPDICIGTDSLQTPKKDIKKIVKIFENNSLKTSLNYPYEGTIIPSYFKEHENVKSIMIEVNKNLYLNESYMKNENFNNIQNIITNVLQYIWEIES